jgi:arylsulfatase A-like enzyme
MSRPWRLRAGLAAAAAGLALASAGGAVERVLLISIDSLRADEVGAGGGAARTPHLDRMAREGVLVDGAYTPVPSTGPAHASLLTGLYPWHHGVLQNALPLDPRTPTLADAARARGLATAAFVSSELLGDRFGFHQGFDHFRFDPTEPLRFRGRNVERFWSRGEATAREAMRWLTAHASGPFLLWVNLADPAPPFELPPGRALAPQEPIELPAGPLPAGVRDAEQLTRLIRAHRAEVAYADAQLGALVERLRLLARLDETAVVLTSSHGEGLGAHGALVGGDGLFEESVRVPLVLRGPGLTAGRRLEGLVQLEDLAPTLLAWIGAEPPASLDGRDLLPWLRGVAPRSPREAALGRRRSHPREPDLFFAREGDAKWIGRADAPGTRFDLARDPRELAGRPGEGMPERLHRALAGSGAAGPAQGVQSR